MNRIKSKLYPVHPVHPVCFYMEFHVTAWLHPYLLMGWVVLLSFFFAKVEIHIEGDAGWAANLPTWRIEEHWLLDIFWGGRPMTGYHAWVFSFIALVFHLPIFLFGRWPLSLETRIIACVMFFLIIEDFLWFVLNPAFGIKKFRPDLISWHKHWVGFVPTDYVVFTFVGCLLFWYAF
jgi:hypothetical protein